jgi:hypothetical protein
MMISAPALTRLSKVENSRRASASDTRIIRFFIIAIIALVAEDG